MNSCSCFTLFLFWEWGSFTLYMHITSWQQPLFSSLFIYWIMVFRVVLSQKADQTALLFLSSVILSGDVGKTSASPNCKQWKGSFAKCVNTGNPWIQTQAESIQVKRSKVRWLCEKSTTNSASPSPNYRSSYQLWQLSKCWKWRLAYYFNLSCNKMNKISDFLPQNQKSYIDFNAWNWIQTITALILDAVK